MVFGDTDPSEYFQGTAWLWDGTTLHDLNAAAQWADRVMLLKDGHTVAAGTPEEVLTAENLRAVYETELYVGRNPATGAIAVLPASAR